MDEMENAMDYEMQDYYTLVDEEEKPHEFELWKVVENDDDVYRGLLSNEISLDGRRGQELVVIKDVINGDSEEEYEVIGEDSEIHRKINDIFVGFYDFEIRDDEGNILDFKFWTLVEDENGTYLVSRSSEEVVPEERVILKVCDEDGGEPFTFVDDDAEFDRIEKIFLSLNMEE